MNWLLAYVFILFFTWGRIFLINVLKIYDLVIVQKIKQKYLSDPDSLIKLWYINKTTLEHVRFFFSFAPHSMWDFSSPARYWTRPLAMRVQSPNHQGTLYRGLNIYISLAIYSRTFSVKFNLVFNILFKSNLLHKPSLVLPDLFSHLSECNLLSDPTVLSPHH